MNRQMVCNFASLSPDQRGRYHALRDKLRRSHHEMAELQNGYSFAFPRHLLVDLAEFTSLEGLCCPFVSFAIDVPARENCVWLHLVGPDGAKTVIEAELFVTG